MPPPHLSSRPTPKPSFPSTKHQSNSTALLNFHLTLPLYNLPSNNNEKQLQAITWNSCTFRNTEMQQSSAVTFLERSNGHRHQLFCLALTLQSHVCNRSILYGLSYFRFQLHHLALRLVVPQNCQQIYCTHPKIIFFSVKQHVQNNRFLSWATQSNRICLQAASLQAT